VAEGKIRAWTNDAGPAGVVAAYVGMAEGRFPLQRAPATQICASPDEARHWIEAEARALGVSIDWSDS
jgi:hypothetical protein